MEKIAKLPEEVVNQIAAGEVVERPASVVKELVENSIDAEADQVQIYIEQGGKGLIRVVDNGVGMNKVDLVNAVKRHWTSKIASTDDILNLVSMGFRGEALASIASVSKFKLRSRVADQDYGWEITLDKDIPTEPKAVGMPSGSEVITQDLFYNIPARQKFLRADQTEFAHIHELVHQFALAHPDVSFTLFHYNKKRFQVFKDRKQDAVIKEILGDDLAAKMLAIRADHPQIKVFGWIGKPGVGTTRKAKQLVFVNQRPVENKLIWGAVSNAYGSVLGRQEKPQYVLMLEISPHLVDVNVHPQKKEIKFVSGNLVFQLIKQAVKSALADYAKSRWGAGSRGISAGESDAPMEGSTRKFGYRYPRSTRSDWSRFAEDSGSGYQPPRPAQLNFAQPEIGLGQEDLGKVQQVLSGYIVEERADGLVFYDQHAVHERILYDKFVQKFLHEFVKGGNQPLLVPEVVQLTPTEQAIWEESRPTFDQVGFKAELVDESKLKITQVPATLSGSSISNVIKEVLEDLAGAQEIEGSKIKEVDDQTHRRLAFLACRSAIKVGDLLSGPQAKSMLKEFKRSTINFTCPHGRPVSVKISKKEIEKWFRR